MTGGLYLWKDGREVPDTMNVSMQHEEEMLFNWTSGFGNDKLGVRKTCSATTAPSRHAPQSIRYTPQKVNRRDGNEMIGKTPNERSGAHAELPRLRFAIRPSSRTARSSSASAFRSPAAWPWKATASSAPSRWDSVKEEIV